jgi:hypothetical protein
LLLPFFCGCLGDNWGLFSIGLLAVFVFITYPAWRHVKRPAKEAPKTEGTDPLSKRQDFAD